MKRIRHSKFTLAHTANNDDEIKHFQDYVASSKRSALVLEKEIQQRFSADKFFCPTIILITISKFHDFMIS